MRSRLSNVIVQMLLYLYVNLRLMNKLISEMDDFFRSSSKDTLRAREVHRMVLGGLNVQILHQKMLIYVVHVLVKRSKTF